MNSALLCFKVSYVLIPCTYCTQWHYAFRDALLHVTALGKHNPYQGLFVTSNHCQSKMQIEIWRKNENRKVPTRDCEFRSLKREFQSWDKIYNWIGTHCLQKQWHLLL